MFTSLADELADIESAVKFLCSNEKVDKRKIFVVSHSESALLVPRIDFTKFPVRGVVMLSPRIPASIVSAKSEETSSYIEYMKRADKSYDKTFEALKKYTSGIIKNASREGVFVLRRPVFVKRMAEIDKSDFLSDVKRVNVPVLVICGKSDRTSAPENAKEVEAAFLDSGLKDTSSVYFRTLGHFLGSLKEEKGTVKYWVPHQEVLETLKKWLNEQCKEAVPLPDTGEPEAQHVQEAQS